MLICAEWFLPVLYLLLIWHSYSFSGTISGGKVMFVPLKHASISRNQNFNQMLLDGKFLSTRQKHPECHNPRQEFTTFDSKAIDPDPISQLIATPRTPTDQFLAKTAAILDEKDMLKLTISENRLLSSVPLNKTEAAPSRMQDLKSVHCRLVMVKNKLKVQFTYRYLTKDIISNLDSADAVNEVEFLLKKGMKKALLESSTGTLELTLKRGKGKVQFISKENFNEIEDCTTTGGDSKKFAHDRGKNLPVALDEPFLIELGLTSSKGQPITGMKHKLSQIQKFVEILSHLISKKIRARETRRGDKNLGSLDECVEKERVNIIDMGCGLGYLTFASHLYLSKSLNVTTVGVEAREAVAMKAEKLARKLNITGLSFVQGNIIKYSEQPGEKSYADIDILIALHACDTATDEAIYSGIAKRADVIITVPCCHKQLRPQLQRLVNKEFSGSDGTGAAYLEPLRIGIFLERETEIATDTIRALLLEIAGYETTVMEFIGGEHTAKNVMITAVKREKSLDSKKVAELKMRLNNILSTYSIQEQRLVHLLANDGMLEFRSSNSKLLSRIRKSM